MSNLTVTTYSSTGSGVRTLDFTTGNIIVTSTGSIVSVQYPNLTVTGASTGNGLEIRNNTATAATVSMGSGGTEAQAINLLVSQGTYGLTLSSPAMVRDLNFTGFSGSLATNPQITIYGNLTLASTMTTFFAGTNEWIFSSTAPSERTLTFAGETLNNPIRFNGVGGSFRFVDAVSGTATHSINLQNGSVNFASQTITGYANIAAITGTSNISNLSTSLPCIVTSSGILNLATATTTGAFTLTSGNLDLNGFNLNSTTFATGVGTKSLIFDGGNLIVTGSGATAFNNANPANLTLTLGTGSGSRISMTSATAKTFVGGGVVYPVPLDQGGTGDLTVTGVNTFADLSASVTATSPANILFPAGSTTTFTNLTVAGGSGSNRIGLRSATTNTRWLLAVTNGTNINISSAQITDCRASLATGQIIRALMTNNNVNGGNNVFLTFGNEALPFF